ncbi:MAG: hypothetical protein HQ488_04065 [Parcubacteria group bacterium]|nr:hypothetical protein [Parcubacteria group bacterium]
MGDSGDGAWDLTVTTAAGPVQAGVRSMGAVSLELRELDADRAAQSCHTGLIERVVSTPGFQARESLFHIGLIQPKGAGGLVAEPELYEQCSFSVL